MLNIQVNWGGFEMGFEFDVNWGCMIIGIGLIQPNLGLEQEVAYSWVRYIMKEALYGLFFYWWYNIYIDKIIPYIYYLVYLWYELYKMTMTKVIHVHLIFEKKNYYFGSISAIFNMLSEEEVGITKSSLLHAGMTDGSCKMTKRAMIIQSHLIRSCK